MMPKNVSITSLLCSPHHPPPKNNRIIDQNRSSCLFQYTVTPFSISARAKWNGINARKDCIPKCLHVPSTNHFFNLKF